MAPARSSTRRGHTDHQNVQSNSLSAVPTAANVFIDPMFGHSLSMYIEKDVHDRDSLVALVIKHGGTVVPGYSGVGYILVDPLKPSGQNLYRQYANKKGKLILDVRWIHECIKAGSLQVFGTNWAGCKVTGNEILPSQEIAPPVLVQPSVMIAQAPLKRRSRQNENQNQAPQVEPQNQMQLAHTTTIHPQLQHAPIANVDSLSQSPSAFSYMYAPSAIHETSRLHASGPPPPNWGAGGTGIAPQQTHIVPPTQPLVHRWDYDHASHTEDSLAGPSTSYEYRYRDDPPWVGGSYYDPTSYDPATYEPYMDEPPSAPTGQATPSSPEALPDRRGRKRTRGPSPATPASELVANRNPTARSPTPPTRVLKSPYGGNLFTSEDITYLKKYIAYCQEQGYVLSLREICERVALKAPQHTFYSWRRYCNKHQIRLPGYPMNPNRSESPDQDDENQDMDDPAFHSVPPGGAIHPMSGQLRDAAPRNRSPTPPRSLYRSTTGKGVAFSADDKAFLIRFMEYRKSQGTYDKVAFWKDVANKAPHHSRASWMKYWRRHKHEFDNEDDEPLPQPPEKKMRYGHADNVLLAKFFSTKPEGTSDKIFQSFARSHPHHPWKGWQEHHRIHKAKIDQLMQRLLIGESIDEPDPGET